MEKNKGDLYNFPLDKGNTQEPKQNTQEGVVMCRNNASRYNIRLDLARKMKGYQQITDFAKAVGVCRVHMSRIIHGHYHPPLQLAERIARVLGLSLTDIFNISDIRIPELDFLLEDKRRDDDTKKT